MPRFDLTFERGLLLEQVADFSFTDDATPLGPDDSTGSTGLLHVDFARQNIRPALMKTLKNQTVTASGVGNEQRPIGKVTGVSGSESSVGIDIDQISLRLAVRRTVKPFVGRLADGLIYWASLCSIPASGVVVDAAIANQQVALVGFRDNVWLRIKQLCAATGIEVIVQDDTIVVRPPRAVFVNAQRVSGTTWDVDTASVVQTIEVVFYSPQNVVAGDYTVDYSRSNVSSDVADDPNGGLLTANAPVHTLPAGYKKKSVLNSEGTS